LVEISQKLFINWEKRRTDWKKYNLVSISYYVFVREGKKVLLVLTFLLADLKIPSATPVNFVQENTLLQTVTWNNL